MSPVHMNAEAELNSPVSDIPLPNAIPRPPNLGDVPARVLQSATIETLIDFSDDLASRLKVHIRRGGELESEIIELENQLADSERIRGALQAQVDILREKDRAVSEKQQGADSKFQRVQADLNLAKLEIAELSRRNADIFNETRRAEAYRRRIARWVAPGYAIRARQMQDIELRTGTLQSEIMRLNALTSTLREELAHQKSEADRRLTSDERDRARLVEHYEKTMARAEKENVAIRSELAHANQRLAVLDQATNDGARANNEKVFFERRAEELEARLKAETERMRGTIDDMAAECSTLRASVETARKLREEADRERAESDTARVRAETQLKSLREIWQESSIRLQALEAQNEALEKMNAEISRKLTQARDESRIRVSDQALDRVGFVEETDERKEKLKKLDLILTDLEMKAFGIQPSSERSSSP